MQMQNKMIEVTGSRWLVREARSIEDALNAISHARVTGSVGSKTIVNDEVTADVVRVNSDGSERKPYTDAY